MPKPSANTEYKSYVPHIIVGFIVTLALLWQGSYFSIQYILLMVVPFAALALSKQPLVITLNTILLAGIALIMLVSLLLMADDLQVGLREWLRYLLMPVYLCFFVNSKEKGFWYMKAFFAGVFGVALLGIMAYTGGIVIPGGIIESSGRFQSTIQYANTAALLMLVGTLYSVHYFIKTRKWRYPMYAAGFLVCLYLTGSRTAFVLFFLVALLFILTGLKLKTRLILLGSLILSAVGLFLLGGRIVQISFTAPTLIERVITWQDSLAIAIKYPLLGLGIGNWQTGQFLYQSAPYGVRYIHNYYAQLLIDGGFLAAMLFLAVIVIVLWRGRKDMSVHHFVIFSIAFHSFFEFNMQFAAVILILMFSLAQMPDLKIRIKLPVNKPVRSVSLVTAVLFFALWIAEFNYAVPDPFGESFREAELLAANEELLLSIEKTEELLQAWRFNENFRMFYPRLLERAVVKGVLPSNERSEKIRAAESSISEVNPLYVRYIDPGASVSHEDIDSNGFITYETDIIYYPLSDARWVNQLYSSTENQRMTYLMFGHMPTAMAMVVSTLLEKEILPTEIGEFSIANGFQYDDGKTDWALIPACAEEYGLACELTTDISSIKEAVRNGALVAVAVNALGKQLFTLETNVIIITGLGIDGSGNEIFIIRDPDVYEGKFTMARNRRNYVVAEGDKLFVRAEDVYGEMSAAFIINK